MLTFGFDLVKNYQTKKLFLSLNIVEIESQYQQSFSRMRMILICKEIIMKLLSQLKVGQKAIIKGYVAENLSILQRLLEMGMIKNTTLEITKVAPLGDPIQISIRGYSLSIRKSEANLIEIESD